MNDVIKIKSSKWEAAACPRLGGNLISLSYDGKNVISFDVTTFAGNTLIEEIVVQTNIRLMPDMAFEGCTSLKCLTLQHTTPSSISVGFSLLEGAPTCYVYVPQEGVGQFYTDYFWGHYAGRVKGL